MEIVVQTNDLSKKFGSAYAVNNLNLKIPKGEIYGFLGPNGAGKSTTIRMLLGLMKPTFGEVQVFGKNLNKHRKQILRKVGALVENPSYYPHLTAYENLEVLRKILGVPQKRIVEVLDIVKLSEVAHKKVKGFSLGMKQRLGIAASLLNQPQLLILDEPTNGLDPAGIIEIRELIQRLPEEYGMTVIISSHLLSEIEQVATRVGVIHKGKMIFQDTIESMMSLAKPQVRIRVEDTEQAKLTLRIKGMPAEQQAEHLFLSQCTDEEVADAIRFLVEAGHSIYRVEEKKRSLEEIFLELTAEGQVK